MNVLKKAPNVVVVCATLLVGLTLVCITLLILAGRNPSEVEKVLGTILSGLGVLAGTGAWVYSSAGTASADKVEQHLNGEFDGRLHDIMRKALEVHDLEVHGAQPTVPPPIISTVAPPEVKQ